MSTRIRLFAEKALINARISKLPIQSNDIQSYLESYGWKFAAYDLNHKRSLETLEKLNLLTIAQNNTAFTYISIDGLSRLIFYRHDLSEKEKVLVFAHELGHIEIGHSGIGALGYNDGVVMKPQEEEANDFAVEFLAPTYVLRQIHANTIKDIQKYTLLDDTHCGAALSNLQNEELNTDDSNQIRILFSKYLEEIHKNRHKHNFSNILRYAVPAAIIIILSALLITHQMAPDKQLDENINQIQTITTNEPVAQPTLPQATDTAVADNSMEVLVTSSGKKYHLPDCRYVKNKTNVKSLSIEEVIKEGYEPCDVCTPDKQ